jgi:hypothetical protein
MGFLDWMKRNDGGKENAGKEQKVFLSQGERWALRRMTQHFDDGLVGYQQGGDWEKAFNKMAERLDLRPRDAFGDRPVSIGPKEAQALREFQKVYEHDADGVYPGNSQMRSDAEAIREALDRDGKPEMRSVARRAGQGYDIEF